MSRAKCPWSSAIVALVVGALAAPAGAQFDPQHNHLKCYRIKDAPIVKTIVAENQFGRERIVKLVPQLLCLPTKKICCGNPPAVPGCNPVPCPPDPLSTQPAPVDHYKCYKIVAKLCAAADLACATVAKAPKPPFVVSLLDQFGAEQVTVGPPQYLCAPVQKVVIGPTTTTTSTTITTTTTSTTTTTLRPCQAGPDALGLCNGACPTGFTCLAVPGAGCDCFPPTQQCTGVAPSCNGLCPKVTDQCLPVLGTTTCDCQAPPPPVACNLASFPVCNGQCPSPMVCEKDFTTTHCVCCNLGGLPCTTNADCCTQSCVANVCL